MARKLSDEESDPRSIRSTRGRCSLNGNAASCSLGTVAAGRSVTVTIGAVATSSGKATNVATVNASANSGDDAVDNTDRITFAVVKPTLALRQAVDRATLRPGETATFTIRVRNPSRRPIRQIRTCDRLPAGLAYVSSTRAGRLSDGAVCWTADALGAGRTVIYELTVRALAGAAGSHVIRAAASSPNARSARAVRAIRVLAAVSRGGGVTG